MPLCQVDRSDSNNRRPFACIQEHLSSGDEYIGCQRMKRNSFILPEHLKKYSMTRLQLQLREQGNQRKRMGRQGQNDSPARQNDSPASEHTTREQQRRAAGRERERKRMDEARAARSQMARRSIMTTPHNANQNVRQQTKRTRSERQTAKRVTRARK